MMDMIPKIGRVEAIYPTRDTLSKARNYRKGQAQRDEFIEYLNTLNSSSPASNRDTVVISAEGRAWCEQNRN